MNTAGEDMTTPSRQLQIAWDVSTLQQTTDMKGGTLHIGRTDVCELHELTALDQQEPVLRGAIREDSNA